MDIILQILGIIFWFIVILVPVVAIHEFGHLLMARLFGVKIPEYAIGLPLVKRTFYFKWKGTIWSFYWTLLGGFVRIWGDNDAIDESQEIAKTDPQAGRKHYIETRYQEILNNQELKFFIEENGLVYDETWKTFEKSKYAKGQTVPSEKEKEAEFEKQFNQLNTLIEWEYDKEIKAKDTFFHKNWLQQSLIIAGGVTFNLITAFVLFWSIFSLIGSKAYIPLADLANIQEKITISSQTEGLTTPVIENSIASSIGLKSRDRILSFAGVSASEIKSQDDFKKLVEDNKNQTVEVEYFSLEKNEIVKTEAFLEEKDGKVIFGVGQLVKEVEYKARNLGDGMVLAFNKTSSMFISGFQILGQVVVALFPNQDKQALQYVAGPIAVSSISSSVFEFSGVSGILDLMGAVSVSLAVFNLLPIPALDGGRWLIITINKVLGKRNRKLEGTIIGFTFIALMGLGILIAIRDVGGVIDGTY